MEKLSDTPFLLHPLAAKHPGTTYTPHHTPRLFVYLHLAKQKSTLSQMYKMEPSYSEAMSNV